MPACCNLARRRSARVRRHGSDRGRPGTRRARSRRRPRRPPGCSDRRRCCGRTSTCSDPDTRRRRARRPPPAIAGGRTIVRAARRAILGRRAASEPAGYVVYWRRAISRLRGRERGGEQPSCERADLPAESQPQPPCHGGHGTAAPAREGATPHGPGLGQAPSLPFVGPVPRARGIIVALTGAAAFGGPPGATMRPLDCRGRPHPAGPSCAGARTARK